MNAARTAFFNYMHRAFGFVQKALQEATPQTYGEPEVVLYEEEEHAEVRLYADIMPQMYCEWLGMGVSDVGFARALDRIPKGYRAVLRINSNGGDVTVGVAIAARVADAKLPVVIDGVAASIASVVAAASPHVTMKPGTTVMLHNPWSCVCGNARALRAEAGVLDTLREAMLDIYHGKTGEAFPRDSWTKALDGTDGADGTWWTGDQAVSLGFADVYEKSAPLDKEKAKALLDARRTVAALTGVPLPKSLELETEEPTLPEPAPTPQPVVRDPAGAKVLAPSVRVSNRPGAFRIPR